MKIYQIHEYGGEWEDSFDRIVKSTTKKEKAEVWKKEYEVSFEKQSVLAKQCDKCPLGMDDNITVKQLMDYCPRVAMEDFRFVNGEIADCNKYNFIYEENTQYRIEEVEVEE